MMRKEVLATPEDLAQRAAQFISEVALEAVALRGQFHWALAGGGTPLDCYRLLAAPPLVEMMPWENIHLFWGDERMVEAQKPQSNYGTAWQALAGAPIPPRNLHPVRTDLSPAEAAANYETRLRRFWPDQDWPRFDLALLGLGGDGHTASLFPGGDALDEREAWAVAVPRPEHLTPQLARVTLTLPVFNAARRVLFLVSGAGKAPVARRILADPQAEVDRLPAARVNPHDGQLIWMLDLAATGQEQLAPGTPAPPA